MHMELTSAASQVVKVQALDMTWSATKMMLPSYNVLCHEAAAAKHCIANQELPTAADLCCSVHPDKHGPDVHLPARTIEYMLCHEKGFSTAKTNYASYLVLQQQRRLFHQTIEIEQASTWPLQPQFATWLPVSLPVMSTTLGICTAWTMGVTESILEAARFCREGVQSLTTELHSSAYQGLAMQCSRVLHLLWESAACKAVTHVYLSTCKVS